MANGFIQSHGGLEVEDIGDDIFNELSRRSFFHEMQEGKQLAIVCKMHDLIHDLACSVMGNECSSMKIVEVKNVSQRVRHVSLSIVDTLSKSKQPYLRTLIFFLSNFTPTLDHLLSSFSRLKCLRVLDLTNIFKIKCLPSWIGNLKHLRYLNLGNTNIVSLPKSVCSLRNLQVLVLRDNEKLTTLPPSIGNLKNLRYLDLDWTGIKVLPPSVCSLTNLQTLKLFGCSSFEMLPREMNNMRSLRHLEITPLYEILSGMPVGIGELTHLETLPLFPIINNSECDAAGIQELKRLNKLKGTLKITGLSHVCDPIAAQEAELKSKTNLSELHLDYSSLEENIINNSTEVLEELEPHPNLQKLRIDGYPGLSFRSWVRNSTTTLPNLISLILYDMPIVEGWSFSSLPPCLKELEILRCPKLKLPTTLVFPSSIQKLAVDKCNDPTLNSVEKLPHLTSLKIWGFDEEETLPETPLLNLTCLQTLRITNCEKLKRLPTELENLATLTKLEIWFCGELEFISEEGLRSLTSLEELWIWNCRSIKSLSESSSSSLRHLTALWVLWLINCQALQIEAVDFQHLIVLRHFY